MSGKQGALSERPTQLPARYRPLFAWALDRRAKPCREIAADQFELWQALGGVEGLSPQELAMVERIVFIRRRVLEYESALLHNSTCGESDAKRPVCMDHGVYTNHVNVLLGLLKALGLGRRQRPVRRLHEHLAAAS
jgi:hypothetical protein